MHRNFIQNKSYNYTAQQLARRHDAHCGFVGEACHRTNTTHMKLFNIMAPALKCTPSGANLVLLGHLQLIKR